MKPYDLLVIGGGSAGYNAARVSAELGRKVAVVDGARRLGGLCILRGCMPSKTLLYSAEALHRARHASSLGLRIPAARMDMRALHARKVRVTAEFAADRFRGLTEGKFRLYRQAARFLDPHTVELGDGRRLQARRFLIATGSKVSWPAVPGLRTSRPWTSDEVLELDFVPRSVLVLGGGLVACELSQFLRRIGTRVVMLQRGPQLLRHASAAAAGVVEKALADEGVEVLTGTALEQVTRDEGGFRVKFVREGRTRVRRAEHCLNALGRVAAVDGLALEAAGVRCSANGQVRVNRWQQTSAPHIYAAGDCAGPVEIVHVAVQQGELAARHAAGLKGLKPVDYRLLLSVVFTEPALATIGRGERELGEAGIAYREASYPFNDHGKSILMGADYGHVRLFAAPKTGRILGAEIVGPDAGELIHCLSGPLAMGATVFDLLRAPWYHPTLSEILTYPLEELAAKVRK